MTPAFRTFLAVVLGVVAVAAAEKASQYQTGAQWLVVVLLVVAFVVAVCAVGGAVWAAASTTVSAALYERRLARRDAALMRLGMLPQPSSAFRRWQQSSSSDPNAIGLDEYWSTARQASAEAERAAPEAEARHARREAEQAPVRDGWTQPMPTVVDAQPSPWSPPMAQVGGGR